MSKKIGKRVYCLSVDNDCGHFQFHVWALNASEAKSLVVDVYNNRNYNEELPKERSFISHKDIKVKRIYNNATEDHVISAIWSSSYKDMRDYKTNCINNFIDDVSKVIDNFENEV